MHHIRIGAKLPVFGPLLRKVAVARFSRTLGTMVASGVPSSWAAAAAGSNLYFLVKGSVQGLPVVGKVRKSCGFG